MGVWEIYSITCGKDKEYPKNRVLTPPSRLINTGVGLRSPNYKCIGSNKHRGIDMPFSFSSLSSSVPSTFWHPEQPPNSRQTRAGIH